MEIRGVFGGFYRITEWIMRFSVTNILWIITSFPIFMLGLFLVSVYEFEEGQVLQTLFLIGVLSPFLLFPSTSAMFTVVRKWLTGQEDAPLLKTFFIGYKENYVKSMLGGIIFMLLFGIMFANYFFYMQVDSQAQLLSIVFIIFIIVLLLAVGNYFCILAHMHMKTFAMIKNAILITVGRPLTSLFMLATNGVIIYICMMYLNFFLVVFFMGSMAAYMTFFHFYRMFNKIQDKQKQLEEKELEETQIEEQGQIPN